MTSTAPSDIALALGRIPTGLYIVTTLKDGAPLGFLGSFVMQVGFDPPRVLVAVARGREHLEAMRVQGRFGVSILGREDRSTMGHFFRKYAEGEGPFDNLAHSASPGGVPVLDGALAWLDCRVTGEHEAGDHVVVFGEVEHGARRRQGDPAVHLRENGLSY